MEYYEKRWVACSETGSGDCAFRGLSRVSAWPAKFCAARNKYCYTSCEYCHNTCPCPQVQDMEEA